MCGKIPCLYLCVFGRVRALRAGLSVAYDISQGALPHGLSFAHNNVQVVEMLGEPHNKGGNNVPVWIEYQDKGLQINFKGLSFEVSALSCVRVGAAEMFWLKHEKCD
jgi:hypothetical protein